MRAEITHSLTFAFETPAKALIALLRLSPRNHAGQFVDAWRIDVDFDGPVRRFVDPFGNVVHALSVEGPVESLAVSGAGIVETSETSGVVGDPSERMPAAVFLRATELTAADRSVEEVAASLVAAARDGLDLAHRLNGLVCERIAAVGAEGGDRDRPAETLAAGEGSAADRAHLFAAVARTARLPARVVRGYLVIEAEEGAGGVMPHVWNETLLPGLGWVGFDPSAGLSTTEAHVRVAGGLDALAAAPVRSFATGGTGERLCEAVRLQAGRPAPAGMRGQMPPDPPAGGAGRQSQ